MVKKSGARFQSHLSLSLLRSLEGEPVGTIGYVIDMTDRQRVEKALRASEERFRKIYEEVPVMMHSIDKTGVIRNVNSKWLEELGYRREEVLGAEIEGFLTPASRVMLREVLPRFWREGRVLAEPYQYVKKDGTVIDVLLDSVVTEDPLHGRISLSAVRDISAQKRAEEALRESESTLKTLLQAAPIGIGQVTEDRILGWTNRVLHEMTGYSADELMGESARMLYESEEEFQRVGRVKHAEVRRQGTGSIETRFKRKDGSVFDALLSSSAIASDDLSRGMVFTVVNITQRKRLEAQLLRSQKMEAIGTLAGGVAHDFNNLLHVIRGYADLALLNLRAGDPGRAEFREIKTASETAAELTKGLLTFSRGVESTLSTIDLNHELRQVSRLLERTIPKMIKIDLRLGEDLKPVKADPGQVQQIVMNLSLNARDAMPDGGELVIETRNVHLDREFCGAHDGVEPGEYVMLAVSDDGFGMIRETVERIFEPFFTTKASGQGTGLGLSIVYGIVRSHGGTISCYSEPGQGTSFNVYLPAAGEAMPADEMSQMGEIAGGDETILMVDDEASVRKVAVTFLKRFGYKVLSATNGREGVEVFSRNRQRISLVILDLIMPEMGGRECLHEILKISPTAKVIIASGYAANGQIDKSLEEGARASIRKPFGARQLLETVRKVLDEQDATRK